MTHAPQGAGTASPRAPRCAALALLAALLAGCPAPRPQHNVLLVTLDTTRPDFMGTYGFGSATPGFDDLAAEGVRFDRALSASALTPSSHATIFTGLYPDRHGVRVLSAAGGYRLGPGVTSLSTWLGRAGYHTAGINSAFPVSSHFGFDHGFDRWESMEGSLSGKGSWNVDRLQRRSDDTTDVAIAVLEELPEPFFLWVHYWDPHDSTFLPPGADEVERVGPSPVYALEVRYMGEQFQRLCDDLRRRGLWDRTITLLTADHGEGLTDGKRRHGWSYHRIVYDEQLRVPLILRGPGVPRGKSIASLVRTVDIAPTLYDLLGLPVPEGLDGSSLRPLLEGTESPPRSAYAEQINAYDLNARALRKRPLADFLYCLVQDGWKLIYRPHMFMESELFHLTEDPEEQVNRFSTELEVRARLLTALAERSPWVLAPFEAEGEAALPDAEVTRALAELGYAAAEEAEPDREGWSWTCPRHPAERFASKGAAHACGIPFVPVRD